MKKNWTMRAGLLLLALTLITSCFVGGTLAKYTTSGSGGDTARVAKWGVTVTGEGNAFATAYAKTDNSFTVESNSVVSTEKVVAPGTSGDIGSANISGTAEVAVEVSYEPTITLNNNWSVDSNFYCPLIIKVGEDSFDGSEYPEADVFISAVTDAIKEYTAVYPAKYNFDNLSDAVASPQISWEWPFEDKIEPIDSQRDYKDTKLGKQAAAGNYATITLNMTTTVTQID